MSNYANLPAPTPEGGLNRYLQEIRKFPLLEPEEEYMLAKRWVEQEDAEAAHKMVTSHLRLAAKIAMGYRGYGLPQAEVISEANVGLMQAVKRFDPEKGFRLATYAMWWIRASIQEYILRSWSLVKLGTTSAQKKLFFNLRKAKARIGALEDGDLHPDNVKQIAHDLGVTEDEVISMNRRMSGGDASLNATVGQEGEGTMQWQDWLEDEDADQAADYEERDELQARRELLARAMEVLNDREKDILTQRRLSEETVTLEDLSAQYDVSRERIRQIEVRAFEKLQKAIRNAAIEEANELGIEIIDVRLKRTDLPRQNLDATFARMRAEREREAADEIARGKEAATRIRAQADRTQVELVSEAEKEANIVRGEADARRNAIFAEAFGQDEEFFEFYRSLAAYEKALQGQNSSMVISPESEFFKYLKSQSGTAGAPAAQ